MIEDEQEKWCILVSSFFNSNLFFKTVCKYFYAKKFKHLDVSAKSTLHNYALSTYIVGGDPWDRGGTAPRA